jgi:translation initiation factor IF-3
VRWCTRIWAASCWIRVQADLAVAAIVEQFPMMEGRQMVMVFSPKEVNR